MALMHISSKEPLHAIVRSLIASILVLSNVVHGQVSRTPESEFRQKVRISEDVAPLGEDPFGESVSLYNGSLSFREVDIDAKGSGPDLQIIRTLKIADQSAPVNDGFMDWRLELPHIETLDSNDVTFFSSTSDRCSNFRQAPAYVINVGQIMPVIYTASSWWRGYQLIIPGLGSQDLLKRDSANTIAPNNGLTFGIVTKQNWQVGCLPPNANSGGGEGFLVISPSGMKYWMDKLVRRAAPNVGFALPGFGGMTRKSVGMMVTHQEDRFGNSLDYGYDDNGNLQSITANDGRSVSITYEPYQYPYMTQPGLRIHDITLQPLNGSPRRWIYSYSQFVYGVDTAVRLASVQLPDNSSWAFDFGALYNSVMSEAPLIIYDVYDGCHYDLHPEKSATAVGTVRHPSGLIGKFTLRTAIRGRSYVPKYCSSTAGHNYLEIPNVYATTALVNKAFSGAGIITPIAWSYSYSSANQSWNTDCAAECASTVWTDVTDPSGNTTRNTFSNRFDATESQLIGSVTYNGAVGGSVARSESFTYTGTTGQPWPVHAGYTLQEWLNAAQTEATSERSRRLISQDGDTYIWQADSFNAYAQVTKQKRYSSIGGQSVIEESLGYLNDTNLWVLGLPLTVTNVGTGEVEISNTYNSLDEIIFRAHFGQTLMTYTWNSAGQLASFTDGNNHTTNLSNYYRGIPRSIGYPDGTSQTLTVDDLGQITSIKDQAGRTTGYSYDAAGRVSRITYPYDSSIDSAQWYPKVFTYAYVTSAERGVGAGHWRRTATQGNYIDTTYFDAMLRPVLSDTSNGSADISSAAGYDWRGLTTFASYPMAGSPDLSAIAVGTHSTYDALGRLTQTQQDSELGVLTTSIAYLSGAREQTTDPKNNVTTTTYQVFDEPDYKAPILVQAPTGIAQAITRDVYGNPLSITQSGTYGTETDSVTKSMYYDSYHRLCRTTEPETGSTVMAYDPANNLAWSAEGQSITGTACGQGSVAAAAQTARTYDAMNRLLTILPPSGTQSTTYTYDAMGRVYTAVSGVATQGFAYNSLGALTGESLQVAGSGFTWALGYGYDAYGHRATVTYPAGTSTSETVSYAPDALGRPTQVGSYATGISYFPSGQVESFTYGNGRSHLSQQNTRQLASNFSDGAGSMLDLSEDFAYDANGNMTVVNDLTGGLRSKSFGYDALNRLTSATAANLYGTESYTYDPINNLRTRLTGGQTLTYNYDATNKLASITQGAVTISSLTYNPQGDTIGQNSITLAFDAKHQLTSLPGVESYSYDAAGRRVVKRPASGSLTYYFYNQAGQLMFQYAPGLATTTNFIHLGTRLVAQHDHVQLSQPGAISFGTNPNAGSTTVSWGSTPAATSYTLQQSSNGGSSWSTVYGGSATSTTVSGLAGGSYVYRVQACIGSNCSGWTTSATLGVWPAVPTVSVPGGTINGPYTVSWTATAGATGYTVQESFNGGAWSTIATNATAISISRPGATTGSYTYHVEASNAYGTAGWSATSAAVSVNTNYGVVPAPVPTLSVPAASSTGSATVSWTAASPVTSYTLQQSSNGGSTWVTVYNGTATSASLTGLANGSYAYHVQACNNTAGNSVCTVWATGGTLVVTLPPTSAPSLSAPASNGTGSYTVSWGGVATATSYTLQISSNGGSSWSTAYSGGATSWSASSQGNGSYTYRAQACNVGGCGPWSGTGTTTVLLPPANAPGLSVPGSSATGSYTVSWSGVATATSYILQISIDSGGWSMVQSSGATSWNASGQATGTYAYRVQACNASGCGPWSGSGTINVLLPPTSAPSLSVPASSADGSYTVSWGSVATAASYNLQESANGGGWSTVQSGSATSWGASGRGDGTYAYHVQACNASGCGPWSGVGTVGVARGPFYSGQVIFLNTQPFPGSSATVISTAPMSSCAYSVTISYAGASYDVNQLSAPSIPPNQNNTQSKSANYLVGGGTFTVTVTAQVFYSAGRYTKTCSGAIRGP